MYLINFLLLYNKLPQTQWLKTIPIYHNSLHQKSGWLDWAVHTRLHKGKSECVGQTQLFWRLWRRIALNLITLAGQFLEVEELRSLLSWTVESLPLIMGLLFHRIHSPRDQDRTSWWGPPQSHRWRVGSSKCVLELGRGLKLEITDLRVVLLEGIGRQLNDILKESFLLTLWIKKGKKMLEICR